MPRRRAARRASSRSSGAQQDRPRAASEKSATRIETPTTSWPSAASSAAAAEESTPPDMATRTRMIGRAGSYPRGAADQPPTGRRSLPRPRAAGHASEAPGRRRRRRIGGPDRDLEHELRAGEVARRAAGWVRGGLSTQTRPPCASAIRRATGSPSPEPGRRAASPRAGGVVERLEDALGLSPAGRPGPGRRPCSAASPARASPRRAPRRRAARTSPRSRPGWRAPGGACAGRRRWRRRRRGAPSRGAARRGSAALSSARRRRRAGPAPRRPGGAAPPRPRGWRSRRGCRRSRVSRVDGLEHRLDDPLLLRGERRRACRTRGSGGSPRAA